jgi:Beta-galactosidase
MHADRQLGMKLRRAAIAVAAAGVAVPAAAEVRFGRAARPLTDDWRHLPIAARGSTQLGLSFRPRQAEALGLDADNSLTELLAYPFELIRLGAYWNHIEPAPGQFCPGELDRHIDAAERSGKKIIVCIGPVKTFGYPEFFVPGHHLRRPLPEGVLIEPAAHRKLLDAATAFLTRIIERYRDRRAIVAWQVEHEAVDPLGMEHSWRLSTAFVRAEVDAARAADPSRPILMNGFLPTSIPVGLQQGWRTRDQGDSLAVAQQLADIVGIDFYPRHALAALGARAVYLAGSRSPWQHRRRRALFRWAAIPRRQIMVSEGQAEPWETVTTPPNPVNEGMASCLPEHLIENYNQCMSWSEGAPAHLSAYLFWGAEYWLLRHRDGDPRYLRAFARVLEQS